MLGRGWRKTALLGPAALGVLFACVDLSGVGDLRSEPDLAPGPLDGAMDAQADVEPPAADADPPLDDASAVVLVDGADPDAFIAHDAGAKVDASGCSGCDCDRDGFVDRTRDACAMTVSPDADLDCDDEDSRSHPRQSFLEDLPEPPQNGDWNCSNAVEKLFATNVNCVGFATAECNGRQGFEGDPGCGVEGKYVICKAGLFFCNVGSTSTRKQACR